MKMDDGWEGGMRVKDGKENGKGKGKRRTWAGLNDGWIGL